jgi:hypothetical protein
MVWPLSEENFTEHERYPQKWESLAEELRPTDDSNEDKGTRHAA